MAGSTAGSRPTARRGAGSAAFDFDKLSHEEQVDFMKKQVVPTMRPLFQAFDAKKYANFGCKTCHGKNAKENKFKMPTAGPCRSSTSSGAQGGQAGSEGRRVDGQVVVKPEMAKLFQEAGV